jgi:heat shock protein HslJ
MTARPKIFVGLLGAASVALVLFTGCSSDATKAAGKGETSMNAPSAAALAGSEWLLEDLGGTGVLDRVQATISFLEGGRIAGNGSCNRFSGAAEITEGKMKVGPLASTRMACTPAVADQETKYLRALEGAERIALNGPHLFIYSKGVEKPLRYTRKQ